MNQTAQGTNRCNIHCRTPVVKISLIRLDGTGDTEWDLNKKYKLHQD
jgi:hypothetical protein